MRKSSFWISVLVLVIAAIHVHGQSYTIKLKLHPDPGQSVVVRESSKDVGSMKFLDLQGKVLKEDKPGVRESVYTETTLARGDKSRTKYKLMFETATEAFGDEKPTAFSFQGRTLLFEVKDSKYRVGVVGKPTLDPKTLEPLVEDANEPPAHMLLLNNVAPSEAVKVGDSWSIDVKKLATETKSTRYDREKSTADAKLIKVYTKNKQQFGVIEVKARLFVEALADSIQFEPPAHHDINILVDAVIDGTSTLFVATMTRKLTGKGKVFNGKQAVAILESDITSTDRYERSAEKDDPKGQEVPVAEFPSGKTEWKEFTSKEGRFSANFPDEPKIDAKKSAKGIVANTVMVEREKGAIYYLVMYSDLPVEASKIDPKALLEGGAKTISAGTKSKKEITLNGFPGLEIVREYEQSGSNLSMKAHLYMVKNRLYQVFVVAETNVKDKAEVEKFLDSFRLVEKADDK